MNKDTETIYNEVVDQVNFCLTKCGEGYCNAVSGKEPRGYPCIEYICTFCKFKNPDYCKFCKGEK